jgi:hypothetical protein
VAVVQALGRGGQWEQALARFEQVRVTEGEGDGWETPRRAGALTLTNGKPNAPSSKG